MRIGILSAAGLLVSASGAIARDEPYSLRCFRPERREAERAYERGLNEAVSADRLRGFHERLAREPHLAGTEGDRRAIEAIAQEFEQAGLEVQVHWIWPYLSRPVKAEVEIVSPERIALEVTEPPIEEDPDTKHPNLTIGFNAYSGSGDVTGEVVYANFGRKEDFEKLHSMGVDCAGKIVIARFGGNFRGFKAKFAERAGAAGLIIYTDPAESGYMRGLMYPEGGWATAHQIQRGSLQTMPYWGDPLTPNVEATEEAARLDPGEAELPAIPVQPVGWAAAQRILERMAGAGVPEESWQGALPFAYRVSGGPRLRVRVHVEQERAITKTANVIGTLRGSKYPEELVILGCHHDAWCFGAADPLAGTHVLLESARVFGEAAARGERPERTIIFTAWAAEEHGIIGSSEWVEANHDRLYEGGVAYFNLDMAAMGPLFGANGSPTLTTLILDATRDVPQARDAAKSVFEEWTARKGAMAGAGAVDPLSLIGTMGGGSDHVGFYFHVGMPCASVGGSGARGTAYHSNYDTMRWYRQVVGEDYEPSIMVTRVLNVCAARLARADILPIDVSAIAPAVTKHLDDLEKRAKAAGLEFDFGPLRQSVAAFGAAAQSSRARLTGSDALVSDEGLWAERRGVNRTHRLLERVWSKAELEPDRPWLRHALMAPDRDSGYSAWPLPGLRHAVERRDPDRLKVCAESLMAVFDWLARSLAWPPEPHEERFDPHFEHSGFGRGTN
jgi:N-acetylated-alpha-linked acidic dipeptidase